MIRLALMIPTLDRGGAEKQLTLLATHLPRNRFEVTVCTLTRDGPYRAVLERAGIQVESFSKRWKLDPAAWFRAVGFFRRWKPDIVHTWLFAANTYGRTAARRAGVPYIVGAERCADHWKLWHELAIDRYLAGRSNGLITNSDGVVDFYAQKRIPREKFTVIPNAIEPNATEPSTSSVNWRQELNLKEDAYLIGAVGRLWPQKRIEDLVWGAQFLRFVRENGFLLIAGDGPRRPYLESLRNQLKLQGRIFFLGHRDDAVDWLPQLDAFWIGSGYEGQSNAVMEAMRAGLPVVASDIPGNRDLVVQDETGFLLPLGDRAGFARKTCWLIDHPDQAKNMGAAGSERIKSEFSIEAMVQRYVEFYDNLTTNCSTKQAIEDDLS